MTDVNGVYSLPGLPPGVYTVKFEMHGHVHRGAPRLDVRSAATVTMDQALAIAPVSEVVVVQGATSGAGGHARRRVQRPR